MKTGLSSHHRSSLFLHSSAEGRERWMQTGSSQTLLLGTLFGEIWELRCKVLEITTRKEKIYIYI